MSIQEHLNKIRNAIYGREVRESIAKGIETAYDDASENGNANMEVKLARGTNPNLNTRLNKMDATDSQNTKKIDSNYNEVTAKLDQTEREAFRKRQLEDLDEEVLAAIEGGEGTSFNLLSEPQSNSVTTDKTTFARQAKNLHTGKLHDIGLGGPNSDLISNAEGNLSAIVPVNPNTKYTVTTFGENTVKKLGAFSEYPTSGQANTRNNRGNKKVESLSITTGNNDYYLVAQVSMDNTVPSQLQIEEGERTTYEAPNTNIYIDLDKKSLPPIGVEMTNFSKRSKNLFNGDYQDDRYINGEGEIVVGSDFGYPDARTTNAIECEGGETYVISGEHDRNRWRFEDNNGELVGNANSRQVTVPENAHYMYVYYSLSGEHEKVQIEQGENPTKYSPYVVIDEEFLPEISVSGGNQLVLLGDDFSRYEVVEPFLTETLDPDNVYNLIDDLMNEFPQYVSKSEVATTDLGTPIYQYDIQTPRTQGNPSNKLKIYLNGGTHGDERRALYGTIRFISDLLKQWKEQKSLQFLLSNIHLIYVPTLNPDGLNAGTRVNGNGVDINRNFPTDWTYNPDKESNNYTGENPASEIETNVMMNIIAENPDLYFAIDYHNYTLLETAGHVSWVGADNPLTQKAIRAWGQNYDGEIRLFSPILENHESNLVAILDRGSLGTYNGGTSRFMESKGINAVTLEAVWSYGSTVHDGQELNADIIGNFLLGMVRSYRDLN